jgi:hypothetical protein
MFIFISTVIHIYLVVVVILGCEEVHANLIVVLYMRLCVYLKGSRLIIHGGAICIATCPMLYVYVYN